MNRAAERQGAPGLASMTGFGTASAENGRYRVTVELRSVNHRGLDLVVRHLRNLRLLEHLNEFVRQVEDPSLLNLFLTELRYLSVA